MNNLSSAVEWDSLIFLAAYGVLILLYLVILKLLMNCIEQLTAKGSNTFHRSVIDVQIRQEAANLHTDDKTHTFDAFLLAMTFLKAVVLVVGLAGVFILVTLKLNIFFAFGVAALASVVAWQINLWRKGKGKDIIKRSEHIFIQVGGYNIGTLIFFIIALILVTAGLILLPS